MNSLKVLCLFICVAGWAVTAINMDDGDKMAKASLKLKTSSEKLSFLQTGTSQRTSKSRRKYSDVDLSKHMAKNAICVKDKGDGTFPAIPEVIDCPYDDIRLCENTDEKDDIENKNKKKIMAKNGVHEYNCLVPELYRGVKCPVNVRLPQVNSYPFKYKGKVSLKKVKSRGLFGLLGSMGVKTRDSSVHNTFGNFECSDDCKHCNSGDEGYTFDSDTDDGSVDLKGWEIFQIPTTAVYSKNGEVNVPWISASHWNSETGTYKPDCDKESSEKEIEQEIEKEESPTRRRRLFSASKVEKKGGKVVKKFVKKIVKAVQGVFGITTKKWKNKNNKEIHRSYADIPSTMACQLISKNSSETLVEGCHEGRFVISARKKDTGEMQCFLVVIELQEPTMVKEVCKSVKRYKKHKKGGRHYTAKECKDEYTAKHAYPKIYKLTGDKCPGNYKDCGSNECIAPPNPFQRVIGKTKTSCAEYQRAEDPVEQFKDAMIKEARKKDANFFDCDCFKAKYPSEAKKYQECKRSGRFCKFDCNKAKTAWVANEIDVLDPSCSYCKTTDTKSRKRRGRRWKTILRKKLTCEGQPNDGFICQGYYALLDSESQKAFIKKEKKCVRSSRRGRRRGRCAQYKDVTSYDCGAMYEKFLKGQAGQSSRQRRRLLQSRNGGC